MNKVEGLASSLRELAVIERIQSLRIDTARVTQLSMIKCRRAAAQLGR